MYSTCNQNNYLFLVCLVLTIHDLVHAILSQYVAICLYIVYVAEMISLGCVMVFADVIAEFYVAGKAITVINKAH